MRNFVKIIFLIIHLFIIIIKYKSKYLFLNKKDFRIYSLFQ